MLGVEVDGYLRDAVLCGLVLGRIVVGVGLVGSVLYLQLYVVGHRAVELYLDTPVVVQADGQLGAQPQLAPLVGERHFDLCRQPRHEARQQINEEKFLHNYKDSNK